MTTSTPPAISNRSSLPSEMRAALRPQGSIIYPRRTGHEPSTPDTQALPPTIESRGSRCNRSMSSPSRLGSGTSHPAEIVQPKPPAQLLFKPRRHTHVRFSPNSSKPGKRYHPDANFPYTTPRMTYPKSILTRSLAASKPAWAPPLYRPCDLYPAHPSTGRQCHHSPIFNCPIREQPTDALITFPVDERALYFQGPGDVLGVRKERKGIRERLVARLRKGRDVVSKGRDVVARWGKRKESDGDSLSDESDDESKYDFEYEREGEAWKTLKRRWTSWTAVARVSSRVHTWNGSYRDF